MSNFVRNMGTVRGKEVNIFYLGTYGFFFLLIVFGNFPAFEHQRWYTGLDLNRDNIYSISDLIGWLLWLFHMPGDVLIQGLMASTSTANFFEVNTSSFGKVGSTIFSFMFWYMTGGKRLVKYWFIVLLLVVLKNLPGIPFLY